MLNEAGKAAPSAGVGAAAVPVGVVVGALAGLSVYAVHRVMRG